MRGILSSNAFFNFVNHYRLNINSNPKMSVAKISKAAAELWLQMSPNQKIPYKRTALAVKKFKSDRSRKRKGPCKIIGYKSYVTLGKRNRIKVKEMIAYTEPLNLIFNWDVVPDKIRRRKSTSTDKVSVRSEEEED